MTLTGKGHHHGAATVDEPLHDLVEDTIDALPAATTASCRPPDRLPRPRRVRREESQHGFCRCEVAPHPRDCAAHGRF